MTNPELNGEDQFDDNLAGFKTEEELIEEFANLAPEEQAIIRSRANVLRYGPNGYTDMQAFFVAIEERSTSLIDPDSKLFKQFI